MSKRHSANRNLKPQPAQQAPQKAQQKPQPAQQQKTPAKAQPGRFPIWAVIVGAALLIVVAIAVVLVSNQGNAANSAAGSPTSSAVNSAPAKNLPREINIQEAASMRDSGAFILDVREQSEWDEVHIPNATLIPLGQLEARVKEVPQDEDVVVVCRSGNRSATGRDILVKAGFTRVTSMAGGVNQWKAQGLPTQSGSR